MRHAGFWLNLLVVVLVSIVAMEFTAAIGLRLLGRPVYWSENAPLSQPRQVKEARQVKQVARSEKEPWGVWGIPNSTSHLAAECFDVEYKMNSVGARDRERPVAADRRWIVLGDSVIEGLGVAQRERLTDILEDRLGIEFANFGTAGDVGPLQYLLLYRDLAKRFRHQGVIVGLTPNNDFTDNDANWWRSYQNLPNQMRYRPFAVLSPDRGSYKIIYGANGHAMPREDFNVSPLMNLDTAGAGRPAELQQPSVGSLAQAASKWSTTFSFVRQWNVERTLAGLGKGYYVDDQNEIDAVKLILGDLSREIGARPKILLLLAMRPDLAARPNKGGDYGNQFAELLTELRSDGWTIIDTLPTLEEADRSGDITLGCDVHWNAKTNRAVAEFLLGQHRDQLVAVSTQSVR